MTIWEYIKQFLSNLKNIFKKTNIDGTIVETTNTTSDNITDNVTDSVISNSTEEKSEDLILGIYLNPNDSSVLLTEDYFKTLKEQGYKEVYVGVTSADYPTKIQSIKKVTDSVGLILYLWIWPETTKLPEMMKDGYNVNVDVETYTMSDYFDTIKKWVSYKSGGLLSICIKPDGWDGDQKVSDLIKIDGLDFINPMMYTDFFTETSKLLSYLKLYTPKFNGLLATTLSTYWSDANTSPKTHSRMLEEINTSKQYTKRVILFRAGKYVNNFTGLTTSTNTTTTTTTTSTTTTSTSSTSCPDNDLKKGCQGDNVVTLQKWLNDKGISGLSGVGLLATDGDYGDYTVTVVKYFQKLMGLSQDGEVGPVTKAKMDSYTPSETSLIQLSFTLDSQDNAYQCGPSSTKMGMTVYGLILSESWLATQMKTNSTEGTTTENMANVVTPINSTYKTSLKGTNESFDTWAKLRGYLAKGWPVVLRVQSWIHPDGGEHYVFLYGLDLDKQYAYLGDPSYGKRAISTGDLLERIKKVTSKSVILYSK